MKESSGNALIHRGWQTCIPAYLHLGLPYHRCDAERSEKEAVEQRRRGWQDGKEQSEPEYKQDCNVLDMEPGYPWIVYIARADGPVDGRTRKRVKGDNPFPGAEVLGQMKDYAQEDAGRKCQQDQSGIMAG